MPVTYWKMFSNFLGVNICCRGDILVRCANESNSNCFMQRTSALHRAMNGTVSHLRSAHVN